MMEEVGSSQIEGEENGWVRREKRTVNTIKFSAEVSLFLSLCLPVESFEPAAAHHPGDDNRQADEWRRNYTTAASKQDKTKP